VQDSKSLKQAPPRNQERCILSIRCYFAKEFAVRLCVQFVKYYSVNVEIMFGVGFGAEHMIVDVCRQIYEAQGEN
jgi:hypothetical protein